MQTTYLLKGLDCPHCAAVIEREVGALNGVSAAGVNLMKQTLTVTVQESAAAAVSACIRRIVHDHEPQVEVTEVTSPSAVSEKENTRHTVLRLLTGAVLFVVGLLPWHMLGITLALLIAAYFVLGGDVIGKAVKNIAKGHVFDENFLMSISTVGAFLIGEYPEAVAVMLFYQIGEFFQALSVKRSRRSIAELMDIRPDTATLLRDGEPVTVSPDTVAVDDVIVIKAGERVPLDGVVLTGESALDTAALTGESVPRVVHAGDTVLSGCINQNGVLTVRVTKRFGESTAARIIDLVENASAKKTPTENFITTFARHYTPVVVVLAALLAVIPPLAFGGEWVDWIRRGLAFLVISCPCALVISIPLAFFGGIGAASKRGILVKGGNYLEALDRVGTVVFDKTGTLTRGVFRVTNILPANGFTEEQVLAYAASAEQGSTHPIARSVLAAYGKAVDTAAISDSYERSGKGVCATMNGKPLLVGNALLMEEKTIAYSPCDAIGSKVYVAVDGVYAGCIVIADEIKPDSKQAIAALRRLGVQHTMMLTGDGESIAAAVAAQLGLDDYCAQLLPHQKVAQLEALDAQKRAGTKLVFVGDGINDAPVLARADIGVAMGALGSDAAIEAADVILMTDEPTKLAEAIGVAKATKRIVIQNIVLALGIKGVFLLLGAFGIAGMWEAVFGDVGVALIAVCNAMRILRK